MNTLNIANCSVVELSHNDMMFIEGEGFLDGVTAIGKKMGYVVGYVAGAVQDALTAHGATVADSYNASAVVAFK